MFKTVQTDSANRLDFSSNCAGGACLNQENIQLLRLRALLANRCPREDTISLSVVFFSMDRFSHESCQTFLQEHVGLNSFSPRFEVNIRNGA